MRAQSAHVACAAQAHMHTLCHLLHPEHSTRKRVVVSNAQQNKARAYVVVQKAGFSEVTNAAFTHTSSGSRKSRGAHADAVVFCKAEASARRGATQPAGAARCNGSEAAEDMQSLSSVALSGGSAALDEHRLHAGHDGSIGSRTRLARTHSNSCVDLAGMDINATHSHAASSATLGGLTARERVSMLASGTYLSPRRGLADAPLEESDHLAQARSRQLRSQQPSARAQQ